VINAGKDLPVAWIRMKKMKQKYISVVLALALGHFALAPTGLAAESAIEAKVAATAQANRDLAKKAVTEATLEAIESVKADTKLDLDIRLIGTMSETVARRD